MTNSDEETGVEHLDEKDEIIRKLQQELDHFIKSGIVEVAVRNQSVNEYMHHWERRALKAEAEAFDYAVERDNAYTERNRLVALLARIYPSGLKKTNIEGWHPSWHNCVYIDLPTGQASWHFHDNDAHLFERLPPYDGEWDGHTTDEKYERIYRAMIAAAKEGGNG